MQKNFSASSVSENYYVDPRMIYLAPNGIFLNTEGDCIPISSLRADENGIVVPASEGQLPVITYIITLR